MRHAVVTRDPADMENILAPEGKAISGYELLQILLKLLSCN
jgi:hypothetical protein